MAGWIVVVDDDVSNLKMAGHILSKHNLRVTALRSGAALLKYMEENRPDLILLDIRMPEMDGFETLEKLRIYERENQLQETPVVFLTSDEDTSSEARGFEMGVSDYIRKPFIPEILLRRLDSILSIQQQMAVIQEEATIDGLTGFLNKAAATKKLTALLKRQPGYLMMIDLDSFKLVNDLYGHEMGDKVLVSFAGLIRRSVSPNCILARMGGDEFMVYGMSKATENDFRRLSTGINSALLEEAKKLMGEDMSIPLGASIGITYVNGQDSDFDLCFKEADKALYQVKRNGKHGYMMFNPDMQDEDMDTPEINLKGLSILLAERNTKNSALVLDQDAFLHVYRFIMRYIERYHRNACKVLLTLSKNDTLAAEDYAEYCETFGEVISTHIRKSDMIMRFRKNQYFVFLTDIREDAVAQVLGGILRAWGEECGDNLAITYESEFIGNDTLEKSNGETVWVALVDDDVNMLKMAGHVLSRNNIRVTALRSGKALLEFLQENRPDLILLDVIMPEMDGYTTLEKLHAEEADVADIPVIFLTGDENSDAEAKALSLGAVDFIKKPFTPDALTLRIRQITTLMRLQKNLSEAVEQKTRANETLFIHVVQSLADAIDAKDTYTNGHSGRVAEYTREIAKRYGYNTREQNDIYIMALLHDVGKIGVPDEVINKPARLTDAEFEKIKAHPVVGARILEKITEMPKLAVGARWHHERYGGGGYPDNLKGEEIPEEARIIAVADAYDAMTSYRSYRPALEQEIVKAELKKGKGTQFDPRFADVMLKMMDEDVDYNMREKR